MNSFQVTRACATCEGSGVRESQTGVESDCPVCDGSGDETFAVSLYETESDVREDYPKALAIEGAP